jgi:HlyD family secretion protein
VAKGQLCGKLDPAPFDSAIEREKAMLAAAEGDFARRQASLASMQAELDRKTAQFKRRGVSRKALDATRRAVAEGLARVKQAEVLLAQRRIALSAAEAALANADLRSPADGVIVARNIEAGQRVAPNAETPLYLVATGLTTLRVTVPIGEQHVDKVKVGDKAVITVASLPAQRFSGLVTNVRPLARTDRGAPSEIVVDTPNPDLLLKPGMKATVYLEIAPRVGMD